jgi:heat shock protein HslJ
MVARTGCNVINGHARIDGGDLSFGAMSTTARSCDGVAFEQESRFDSAIRQTRNFRRLPDENKLLLLDGRWKPIMRLSEM